MYINLWFSSHNPVRTIKQGKNQFLEGFKKERYVDNSWKLNWIRSNFFMERGFSPFVVGTFAQGFVRTRK